MVKSGGVLLFSLLCVFMLFQVVVGSLLLFLGVSSYEAALIFLLKKL